MLKLLQSTAAAALSLAAVSASSTETTAQTTDQLRAARGPWGTRQSSSGFSTSDTGGWSIVAVFTEYDRTRVHPDGRPSAWWIARRTSGSDLRKEVAVVWADSRRCPELSAALYTMTELAAPRVQVDGMAPHFTQPHPPRMPWPTFDGTTYTIWSERGLQPGFRPGAVEMSSNGGIIAQWGEETVKALAPCWRSEPPAAAR
ncbi:MAG TPA: hypothetical protein VF699_13905 [Caulobacteraceae bacterium]|jgi:hypothetical protein